MTNTSLFSNISLLRSNISPLIHHLIGPDASNILIVKISQGTFNAVVLKHIKMNAA